MKLRIILSALPVAFIVSACAYRGAVYSEYTQYALDVRMDSTSSSPVQGSFGYSHGVAAFVPRRGTNSLSGEAVSLVSWNHVGAEMFTAEGTNISLSKTSTRMDAGFISGTAATVSAAPSNAVVQFVSPAVRYEIETTSGKPVMVSYTVTNQLVQTTGQPGDRIAGAVGMLNTASYIQGRQLALEAREVLAVATDKIWISDSAKPVDRQEAAGKVLANLTDLELGGQPLTEFVKRLSESKSRDELRNQLDVLYRSSNKIQRNLANLSN